MDSITTLAVVVLAGMIHASFQLSVSMLTLLSGHAIGSKTSHARLLRLMSSFIGGVAVMTALLLSFCILLALAVFRGDVAPLGWAVVCGLLIGLGVAVWLFYYRKGPGTTLWLPRSLARYLSDRTKVTRLSGEAFGLGLTSVLAELFFIAGPVIVSAFVLSEQTPIWHFAGILIYTLSSLLTLLVVGVVISGGGQPSRIQAWRESNKRFLQFSGGGALVVLGFYVYISHLPDSLILGGLR